MCTLLSFSFSSSPPPTLFLLLLLLFFSPPPSPPPLYFYIICVLLVMPQYFFSSIFFYSLYFLILVHFIFLPSFLYLFFLQLSSFSFTSIFSHSLRLERKLLLLFSFIHYFLGGHYISIHVKKKNEKKREKSHNIFPTNIYLFSFIITSLMKNLESPHTPCIHFIPLYR